MVGKLRILLALGVVFFLAFSTIAAGTGGAIFTEDEAIRLSHTLEEWQEGLRSRDVQHEDVLPFSNGHIGPVISIIDPVPRDGIYISTLPLTLLVYLTSFQAPVDISTLTVTGKRGIFSLNITDRLTPFLRQPHKNENADFVIEGNIKDLRAGRYNVILSVADTAGNIVEHSIFLLVQDGLASTE